MATGRVHNTHGFTLIELMVIVAIIGILAALLFPVFVTAREKSYQATCLTHQRQIAAAVMMVAQDNKQILPDTTTAWQKMLLPSQMLVCPTAGKSTQANTYGYNAFLANQSLSDLKSQITTIVSADGGNSANALTGLTDLDYRHNGQCIVSFLDGHALSIAGLSDSANLSYTDLTPQLWQGRWSSNNNGYFDHGGGYHGDGVSVNSQALTIGSYNPTSLAQGTLTNGKGILFDFDPVTPGVQSLPQTAKGSLYFSATMNGWSNYLSWGGEVLFAGDTSFNNSAPNVVLGGFALSEGTYLSAYQGYLNVGGSAAMIGSQKDHSNGGPTSIPVSCLISFGSTSLQSVGTMTIDNKSVAKLAGPAVTLTANGVTGMWVSNGSGIIYSNIKLGYMPSM